MASTSADQLAAKLAKIAEGIPAANRVALGQSALAAKETMIAAAATAGLRPGQRMRGVGKRGAAWSVGYDVKGEAARVGFRGPVHLVEGDTRPHPILAGVKRNQMRAEGAALIGALTGKKVRKAKGRTGRAISTPQGPRASAKHPGTKGRHFWAPAKAKVVQQTPPIYQSAHRAAIVRTGFGR